MAGVADSWTAGDAGVDGHPIPLLTLAGNPAISVVFMRLPDGLNDGSGGSTHGFESLQKLWQDSITQIDAIDGSSAYTKASLTATLTALMDALQPATVRTHDWMGGFGDGDHSDHRATAYFARAAHNVYSSPHTLIGYLAYAIASSPQNVFGADLTAKTDAFLAYVAFDASPCGSPPSCAGTGYDDYLLRQYTGGSEPGGGEGGVPVSLVLPVVSGSAVVGQVLSASSGTWSGGPSSFVFQWRRCDGGGGGCLEVGSGSEVASYLLGAGDLGFTLRVGVTASNGSGPSAEALSLPTAVVAGAAGNPDLALGRAASASSVESGTPFGAGLAVDGLSSTRWSSGYADDQWWQVDLGSVQQVSSVIVDWEWAYGSAYRIQVSTDGSSFTDVASVTLAGAGSKTTSFPAVPARYVRMQGVTRATPWGYSFWAFQVFGPGVAGGVPVSLVLPVVSGSAVVGQVLSASSGTWSGGPSSFVFQWRRCDGGGGGCLDVGSGSEVASYLLGAGDLGFTLRVGVTASNGSGPSAEALSLPTAVVAGAAGNPDLALGRAASASSVESGTPFAAGLAVDGLSSTRWSSGYADDQWWQVDLGSAQQVSSVIVDWEWAYGSAYRIQVSTDGTSFTDVASVTLAGAGSKTTSFPAVPARYVRMQGVTRATPWGYSFWAFQVFGPGAAGGVPVSLVLPVVSGSAVVGQVLSASSGTWSEGPSSFVFQWRRCDGGGGGCLDVGSGSEVASYLLGAGDLGFTLRVGVTASNGSGPSAEALSLPTAVVAGAAGNPDLALGRAASASSVESGTPFAAGLAVDGLSSTRWSSGYADDQWWQVDLGSAQQVSSVIVDWEWAYGSAYRIQVSTDGSSFTDVASVTLAGAGSKTTSFPAVPARYVRMQGVTRATPWGYSFWAFQVFGP